MKWIKLFNENYKMDYDVTNDEYWKKMPYIEYEKSIKDVVQMSSKTKEKISSYLKNYTRVVSSYSGEEYVIKRPKNYLKIDEIDDEWFIIKYAEFQYDPMSVLGEDFDMVYYHFKCDQMSGLVQFLKD